MNFYLFQLKEPLKEPPFQIVRFIVACTLAEAFKVLEDEVCRSPYKESAEDYSGGLEMGVPELGRCVAVTFGCVVIAGTVSIAGTLDSGQYIKVKPTSLP